MKPFWKSWTIWVNLFAAISIATLQQISGFLPMAAEPYLVPVLAILNILLRVKTKQGVVLR